MPLPHPSEEQKKNKEGLNKFMSDCLSNKNIKKDFPNHQQSIAVCENLYRQAKHKKKKAAEASKQEFDATKNVPEDTSLITKTHDNQEPNFEDSYAEIEKNGFIQK